MRDIRRARRDPGNNLVIAPAAVTDTPLHAGIMEQMNIHSLCTPLNTFKIHPPRLFININNYI